MSEEARTSTWQGGGGQRGGGGAEGGLGGEGTGTSTWQGELGVGERVKTQSQHPRLVVEAYGREGWCYKHHFRRILVTSFNNSKVCQKHRQSSSSVCILLFRPAWNNSLLSRTRHVPGAKKWQQQKEIHTPGFAPSCFMNATMSPSQPPSPRPCTKNTKPGACSYKATFFQTSATQWMHCGCQHTWLCSKLLHECNNFSDGCAVCWDAP